MSLPLATLRELQKLAALKAKGVTLERQYEVIKKHVREGNSLSSEDWEAFDLAWDLGSSGVFSEEEWTTQIDGDILGISNSARPTLSSDHAAASSASGKRSAAVAAPAARGAQNRGKRQREDASKGSLNIYNSFALGSGEPVSPCNSANSAMTVDGSGDGRITLEGLDKPYTFAGDGDSSDDEGSSETSNDGCGGGDDQTVEGEGDHSGERVEDGDSSDEDTRETASGQMAELSLVDDDDSMESDDEIHAMEIPDGFREFKHFIGSS
ncbi:unnamed protein product [Ectocarpus sp. CCAP 1310/34]|nr:unnamed protein product [Ectocarpus sp. CCAP 1310/34]